jgi:hypothetical protein
MPILKESNVLKMSLKKSEAEALVFIESYITIKKHKLYDVFLAQASQIEKNKEVSTQENQVRRDDTIAKINQTLKISPPKTWADYKDAEIKKTVDEKAAEFLYAQTAFTIHDEHAQKKQENEDAYKKGMAKLERCLQDTLSDVSHRYSPVYQIRKNKMNEAIASYNEACDTAWSVHQNSVSHARYLAKEASYNAHTEAVKDRSTERERLQVGSRELLKTSYEMVAERIGLDGITPDITTYVSTDTPYASIQPMIGYMDLRLALDKATNNPEGSDLIRHFYDVTSDDPAIDVAILNEAVQSLDLKACSRIFKHRCIFMAPPVSPEERTLYVELAGTAFVTFTVVSPHGEILSQPYHVKTETVGQVPESYTEEGSLRDYIVENTADFVRKLYDCNKVGAFDAFSNLMASKNGFKAHAIKTIAASNQSLKRREGVGDIRLTKLHIDRSIDRTPCGFDETPSHHANEAYHALTSAIDARYYAQCKALEKTCAKAMLEAQRLEWDMCRKAEAVCQLACEEVERELEWDVLAAELSVHAKAFHYFSNPDNDAAMSDQQLADVDVVTSDVTADATPVVAVPKQVNKSVFFNTDRTFGKPKINRLPLSSISEHEVMDDDLYVMDDDDREVCKIMGSLN